MHARRVAGFTIVELMIAVAVVAVLAAIALPSFIDSIRKSRRSEAFTALAAVQQAQERWRANNANYASLLTASPTDTPPGLGQSATTPHGYYGIALSGTSATGYTATATAVSGTSQANDAQCSNMGVQLLDGNLKYAGCGGSCTLSYEPTNLCWTR